MERHLTLTTFCTCGNMEVVAVEFLGELFNKIMESERRFCEWTNPRVVSVSKENADDRTRWRQMIFRSNPVAATL